MVVNKHTEYMRQYRSKPENAAKHREISRQWRERNRERHRAYQRDYVARTGYKQLRAPEQVRKWNLKALHGLTPEQYDEMLLAQGGVCAICKRPEPSKRQAHLSVDHDHDTGKIRGLLCFGCNISLGYYERGQKSRIPHEVARAYLGWW